MSESGPLIVPVEVQAMVINNANMNFIRSGMNYAQLKNYASPSPAPFANSAGSDFASKTINQGVYLLWTLPKALRHGQQNASGSLDFPLVPNRWLVVRVFRPAVAAGTVPPAQTPATAAWVVQSDYLDKSLGSSAFVDPHATALTPTLIGRKVAITSSSSWVEPASTSAPFLQAVSESNTSFAAYQPFNQNVFSIFDDLVTQNIAAGTVSYFVLGWYAQTSADILSGWQAGTTGNDFTDLLGQLNWTATSPTTQTTRSSLYQGGAFGILWQPGGARPASPKDNVFPQVAIGNTSDDGIVAFTGAAFSDPSAPQDMTADEAMEMLEAFQYDLLPMLGQPGADEMIEQSVRAQWFGSTTAGTSWSIVNAPTPSGSVPPPDPSPEELANEASWLSALNAAQEKFDASSRQLKGVQRDLYELWWKKGGANAYYKATGWVSLPWTIDSLDQFDDAMSPLIAQAQTLTAQLNTLATQIPMETDSVSLDEAIDNFARSKNLPSTRVLKASSEPRFWTPVDPVLVISNTAHLLKLDPDDQLACRWPTELATQLNVSATSGSTTGPNFSINSSQLAKFLPAVNWTNLPSQGKSLFQEFFLVDPANAPLVAAAANQNLTAAQINAVASSMSPPNVAAGIAPAVLATYPWAQAWQPLYLDWEIQWFPIPLQQSNGTPNWQFDGLDYDLLAGFAVPQTPILLQGRALLTPKPSFEFKSSLDQFINDYPDSEATGELKEIDDLLETVDSWDFLSQALSGLHTEVASWNPVPTQNPDNTPLSGGGSLQSLIGDQAQTPPNPGSGDTPRDPTVPPSTFEGMRGGQLYINRLTVVDAFGQTLEIVFAPTSSSPYPRTATNAVFHPLLADGVEPTVPISTQEPLRFVQLPPRLLQEARLNFDFLSQTTDDNPIVGWVLPNHLDSGLAVYDPDGISYGEMTLGVDQHNQPIVDWLPSPNSPYPTLPDPAHAQGPLLSFLSKLKSLGASSFSDFLQAVDETLWTVDPLGNRADSFLSVLIGRPLAVVTASLSFELEAEPWRDAAWPYTFDPRPDPLFLKYKFPVRLGDLGYRQDGLIGYFLNGDYSHFNSIHMPESDSPPSGYLKQIAVGNYVNLGFAANGPGAPATLTMIMDPRGSVHSQCGILPVKEVSLVSDWVDSALAKIAITFRTGPMLVSTEQIIPPGQSDPITALLLTSPAEQDGTWSWVESDGKGHWPEIALTPVDGTANFPATAPTLREGTLKLTGGLDD